MLVSNINKEDILIAISDEDNKTAFRRAKELAVKLPSVSTLSYSHLAVVSLEDYEEHCADRRLLPVAAIRRLIQQPDIVPDAYDVVLGASKASPVYMHFELMEIALDRGIVCILCNDEVVEVTSEAALNDDPITPEDADGAPAGNPEEKLYI